MNFKELIKDARQNIVDRGFYTPTNNIGELVMLTITELSEALEAHRINRFAFFYKSTGLSTSKDWFNFDNGNLIDFEDFIKDTFEDEFADTYIRIFGFCGYLKIVPDAHRIIHGDYEYFDNLTPDSNVAETLARITKYLCDILYYPYLEDDRYKNAAVQLFNFVLWRLDRTCEAFNIPIEKQIAAKMAYNKTRPHKHGKEY